MPTQSRWRGPEDFKSTSFSRITSSNPAWTNADAAFILATSVVMDVFVVAVVVMDLDCDIK